MSVRMRKSILISHARVVDADRNLVSEERTIEIDGGRIAASSSERGKRDMDASGLYVCPGLIDAHVHLFLDAGAQPRDTFFESSEDENSSARPREICWSRSPRELPRYAIAGVRLHWYSRCSAE